MFTVNRTRTLLRTLAVLVAATATPGFAAEVVLPHAFSPGTPARANEVNANFAALRNGVNAHDQAITDLTTEVENLDTQVQALDTEVQNLAQAAAGVRGLALEVGGTVVGTVVQLQEASPGIIALSDNGYFVSVSGDPGFLTEGAPMPLPIFYAQANCAGPGYYTSDIPPGDGYISSTYFLFRQGIVIGSPVAGENNVAYLAQGAAAAVNNIQSVWEPGQPTCQNFGATSVDAVPVVANNAATTGVPDNLAGAVRLVTR